MRVLKFGGAGLANATMVGKVADIVKASPGERVVVVSAMSGVTDAILGAVKDVKEEEGAIEPFLYAMRTRHEECIAQLGTPEEEGARVLTEFDLLFKRFERLLYGIAYTEELTEKSRDLAVSFGERLSARVMASALRSRSVKSVALDADSIGVRTDGVYGNASPIMPVVRENLMRELHPLLDDDVVPVVTGFFGADEHGHVTTFGRGGSDYTAAIVAAALEAERLEVWKDVDGFLTADPRLIDEARPIKDMTYDEAAELAYVGAKVLHPRTVEPLKPKLVPIHVKSIERPDAPGTRISGDDRRKAPVITSCATRDGLAIVVLYGPGMAYTPGIGKRVFQVLGDAGINVYNMAASQASFALLVNERECDEAVKLLEATHLGIVETVECIRGMTLVSIVGSGIGRTPGTAGSIFRAVGDAGVNVEMISVGASEIALNFVIREKEAEQCIRAVHDAFMKQEVDVQ